MPVLYAMQIVEYSIFSATIIWLPITFPMVICIAAGRSKPERRANCSRYRVQLEEVFGYTEPMPVDMAAPTDSHAAGRSGHRGKRSAPITAAHRDRKKLPDRQFHCLVGSSEESGDRFQHQQHSAGRCPKSPARRHSRPREVEIVFRDSGGDIDDVTEAAADIVAADDADIIMGSYHRRGASRNCARSSPGAFPSTSAPLYEGGERTPRRDGDQRDAADAMADDDRVIWRTPSKHRDGT